MRKKLGLWMERRGSGYRVVLCEDTRRRIHLLADAQNVLSLLEPLPNCPLCLESQRPQTIAYELQVHDVHQVHQSQETDE